MPGQKTRFAPHLIGFKTIEPLHTRTHTHTIKLNGIENLIAICWSVLIEIDRLRTCTESRLQIANQMIRSEFFLHPSLSVSFQMLCPALLAVRFVSLFIAPKLSPFLKKMVFFVRTRVVSNFRQPFRLHFLEITWKRLSIRFFFRSLLRKTNGFRTKSQAVILKSHSSITKHTHRRTHKLCSPFCSPASLIDATSKRRRLEKEVRPEIN